MVDTPDGMQRVSQYVFLSVVSFSYEQWNEFGNGENQAGLDFWSGTNLPGI